MKWQSLARCKWEHCCQKGCQRRKSPPLKAMPPLSSALILNQTPNPTRTLPFLYLLFFVSKSGKSKGVWGHCLDLCSSGAWRDKPCSPYIQLLTAKVIRTRVYYLLEAGLDHTSIIFVCCLFDLYIYLLLSPTYSHFHPCLLYLLLLLRDV